jgi:hypothetical protein
MYRLELRSLLYILVIEVIYIYKVLDISITHYKPNIFTTLLKRKFRVGSEVLKYYSTITLVIEYRAYFI